MGWNHLSIPKLHWSFGMEMYIHPLYWTCTYLSMLGWKFNHFSTRSPRYCFSSEKTWNIISFPIIPSTAMAQVDDIHLCGRHGPTWFTNSIVLLVHWWWKGTSSHVTNLVCQKILTHWGLNKVVNIVQATFSNVFCLNKLLHFDKLKNLICHYLMPCCRIDTKPLCDTRSQWVKGLLNRGLAAHVCYYILLLL